MPESRSRIEYLLPTNNIIVLDSYFNLINPIPFSALIRFYIIYIYILFGPPLFIQVLRHLSSAEGTLSPHSPPHDLRRPHPLASVVRFSTSSAHHSAPRAASCGRHWRPAEFRQLAAVGCRPRRPCLRRVLPRVALERRLHARLLRHPLHSAGIYLSIQGGPKNRIPSFIFGITSVIQHRF